MGDVVSHPAHYTQGGVECIEITGQMDFCRGNAVKYLWRFKDKENPIQDMKKALFYLKYYDEKYTFKAVSRKVRKKFLRLGVYSVLFKIHGDYAAPDLIEGIVTAGGVTDLHLTIMRLDAEIRKLERA